MAEKYQGWTNYETWNVHLWFSNVEQAYRFWKERAEVLRDVYALADAMKAVIEANMPEPGQNTYSDLLGHAVSRVNWDEIAAAFMEE